jgi:hypothetical protein
MFFPILPPDATFRVICWSLAKIVEAESTSARAIVIPSCRGKVR